MRDISKKHLTPELVDYKIGDLVHTGNRGIWRVLSFEFDKWGWWKVNCKQVYTQNFRTWSGQHWWFYLGECSKVTTEFIQERINTLQEIKEQL